MSERRNKETLGGAATSGTDTDALLRRYGASITEEDRQRSFDEEDERWETSKQIRDWILLIVAVIIWVGFELSIKFFVPGI